MKFYYNGQLIRTSKTHEYKYAVLSPEGKCYGCSATLEGAEKVIKQYTADYKLEIENCEKALKAIEEGKTYYFSTFRRKSYRTDIKKTADEYREYIAGCEEAIARYESFSIVELEAR